MILADTSVWIDHLRSADARLTAMLEAGLILGHPFVLGEMALGNLQPRQAMLCLIADLPAAVVATDAEALRFIDDHSLAGRGIGYVDAHLLAAVRLTADAVLWSRDKRLHTVAAQLSVAMPAA